MGQNRQMINSVNMGQIRVCHFFATKPLNAVIMLNSYTQSKDILNVVVTRKLLVVTEYEVDRLRFFNVDDRSCDVL